MKKYVLISLIVHLAILFLFATIKTDEVEKEKLVKNEVVPIAFVAKQTSDNPGAKTLDTQEREKPKEEKPKSEPKIEKKVEEKKVEEKKPVEKPIEKKAEKTEEKKIESNIPSKNEPSHSDTSSKSSSESSSTSSSDKSSNHSSDGGSPNGSSSGEDLGSNFIADGDGTYIALTSEGINYQIINEVEPDYPSQAESIGYSKKVQVTVKFLVGFDAEVMKAIKKWRFKPIFHKGKNIKVYFTKTFVFEPQ